MTTGLIWTTFAGDLHWFRYSAASFSKFAKGRFNHAVCLVPAHHRDNFREPCEKNGILLEVHSEWPESSFNRHMYEICRADLHMPGMDAIAHFDADCVFTAPTGPEDFMRDGKLICPFVSFDHMLAASGRNSGWVWKSRVDDLIGGDVKNATMTGFPHIHYRDVYPKLREEADRHVHGFEKYARRACPTWPHGFCEFESLGAIAQRHYQSWYSWLDLQREQHPAIGHVAQSYSHGGLDAPHEYGAALGGRQTARQLFSRLGL